MICCQTVAAILAHTFDPSPSVAAILSCSHFCVHCFANTVLRTLSDNITSGKVYILRPLWRRYLRATLFCVHYFSNTGLRTLFCVHCLTTLRQGKCLFSTLCGGDICALFCEHCFAFTVLRTLSDLTTSRQGKCSFSTLCGGDICAHCVAYTVLRTLVCEHCFA